MARTRITPRSIVLVLAALIAAVGATPSAAMSQVTPDVRVAVVDFQNRSAFLELGRELGRAAADELITQLTESGAFTVIERTRMQGVLNEQGLTEAQAVDPATAARIGDLLGAQVVILGAITQLSMEETGASIGGFGAELRRAESIVDVRLVDSSSGEVLMAETGKGSKPLGGAVLEDFSFERDFDAGTAQEILRPTIREVTARIVAREAELADLAPAAAEALIVGAPDAETAYIDRGENFGIREGQRFAVYRIVDEIRDAHGNLLDVVRERVGVVQVERVLEQSAICEVVTGEASEGDEAERLDDPLSRDGS